MVTSFGHHALASLPPALPRSAAAPAASFKSPCLDRYAGQLAVSRAIVRYAGYHDYDGGLRVRTCVATHRIRRPPRWRKNRSTNLAQLRGPAAVRDWILSRQCD